MRPRSTAIDYSKPELPVKGIGGVRVPSPLSIPRQRSENSRPLPGPPGRACRADMGMGKGVVEIPHGAVQWQRSCWTCIEFEARQVARFRMVGQFPLLRCRKLPEAFVKCESLCRQFQSMPLESLAKWPMEDSSSIDYNEGGEGSCTTANGAVRRGHEKTRKIAPRPESMQDGHRAAEADTGPDLVPRRIAKPGASAR